MSDLLSGLRHGARAFRSAPGFAALAVVILATGIGASTAMYTLVQSVLLRELPFQDPDRLVWMYNARTERDRAPLSVPDPRRADRGANVLRVVARLAPAVTLAQERVDMNILELCGWCQHIQKRSGRDQSQRGDVCEYLASPC